MESAATRIRRLRDDLWERLSAAVPQIQLNGHRALRLPNTLSLRFPGVSGDAVLARTPQVAASTGSACHAGHEQASAVILAMGVDADAALGTVRLTLGRGTTATEVERTCNALAAAWRAASLRPDSVPAPPGDGDSG
jgi:cysteine desulfurase